eukprot:jgi/Mesvir1/24708/Mv21987-RA.1
MQLRTTTGVTTRSQRTTTSSRRTAPSWSRPPPPPHHRLRALLGAAAAAPPPPGETLAEDSTCGPGQEPAISKHALEQVHILLFLVAIFHIVYCAFTLMLSVVSVARWRRFEEAIRVKNELNLQGDSAGTVLGAIFRQLSRTRSVSRLEMRGHSWLHKGLLMFFSPLHLPQYEHLRFKFIYIHKVNPGFNFCRYLMLSLQDEFSHLVGLDPSIWCIVLFYVLFDIPASYVRYWLPNLVVIFVLLLNWKVRTILSDVAHEAITEGEDRHTILERRTQMYWFKRPDIMRVLLKLMLFQVSFEPGLTVFRIWQLGMDSCYLDLTGTRVGNVLLILVHFVVSMFLSLYIGLRFIPFYVLALQMGQNFNRNMFSSSVAEQLVKWKKVGTKAASKKASQGNLTKRTLSGLADQSAYHSNALFADVVPSSPKKKGSKGGPGSGVHLLGGLLPQLRQSKKNHGTLPSPASSGKTLKSMPTVDKLFAQGDLGGTGGNGVAYDFGDSAPSPKANGNSSPRVHVLPPAHASPIFDTSGPAQASPRPQVTPGPSPPKPTHLNGSPPRIPGRVPGNSPPVTPGASEAMAEPEEPKPAYTVITVEAPGPG